MELEYRVLDNGIRVIALSGVMDIIGTGRVETQVAGYSAANNTPVLIDLSGVSFLASIGIRLLVITAKSVASRGGKMGLLAPTERVRETLEVTGISNIIPIFNTVEEAQTAMLTG